MPKLKREVEYTKEIDDVAVFLVEIVKDARAGKSPGEIATGSLQSMLTALQGVDQLDDEIRNDRKVALQTIGYRTGELTDVILGDPKSAPNNSGGGDPV